MGCKVVRSAKRKAKPCLKEKNFNEENDPSSPSFQLVQQTKTIRFVLLWVMSSYLCIFHHNYKRFGRRVIFYFFFNTKRVLTHFLVFNQFVINVLTNRQKRKPPSTARAVPPPKRKVRPHLTDTSSDEENIRRPPLRQRKSRFV